MALRRRTRQVGTKERKKTNKDDYRSDDNRPRSSHNHLIPESPSSHDTIGLGTPCGSSIICALPLSAANNVA